MLFFKQKTAYELRISDWSSDVCSSDLTLSFAWPGVACPGPRAEGPDGAAPLFALGYGLSYAKPGEVAQLPVDAAESCGEVTALPIFNLTDAPTFALHVATADAEHALGSDPNAPLQWPPDKPAPRRRAP